MVACALSHFQKEVNCIFYEDAIFLSLAKNAFMMASEDTSNAISPSGQCLATKNQSVILISPPPLTSGFDIKATLIDINTSNDVECLWLWKSLKTEIVLKGKNNCQWNPSFFVILTLEFHMITEISSLFQFSIIWWKLFSLRLLLDCLIWVLKRREHSKWTKSQL